MPRPRACSPFLHSALQGLCSGLRGTVVPSLHLELVLWSLEGCFLSLVAEVRQKADRHPESSPMSPLSCQPVCQFRLWFLTAAHGAASLSLIINSCSNLNPSWGLLSRSPARGWRPERRQTGVCRRQGRKPRGVGGKTSGRHLRRRTGLYPCLRGCS